MFNQALFDITDKRNFAYFMGAAVWLDSHNFDVVLKDKKYSEEDLWARDWLLEFAPLDDDYFDAMELKKFDQ